MTRVILSLIFRPNNNTIDHNALSHAAPFLSFHFRSGHKYSSRQLWHALL